MSLIRENTYTDYFSRKVVPRLAWGDAAEAAGIAMSGFSTGGYVFRKRALSGPEMDEAVRLVGEILDMKGRMIGLSKAITKTIDSFKPGLGTGVSVSNLVTGGGGERARLWFAWRDKANALYEEANQLLSEWDALYDENEADFKHPGVTLSEVQAYHQRFVEMLDKHVRFNGEATEVSKNPKAYEKQYENEGLFDKIFGSMWSLAIFGVAAFVAVKYLLPEVYHGVTKKI